MDVVEHSFKVHAETLAAHSTRRSGHASSPVSQTVGSRYPSMGDLDWHDYRTSAGLTKNAR
jgi:hypothetical protein